MARKIVEELADPAPVVAVVETDLRVCVTVDVRQLLEAAGLASQSGAPSGPELESFVQAAIERFLKQQPYIREAHVRWFDQDDILRDQVWRSLDG